MQIPKDRLEIAVQLVSDTFNERFTNIGSSNCDLNGCRFIMTNSVDTIFLYYTTASEVIRKFQAINNGITCDAESLKIKYAKIGKSFIALVLVYVYNFCLSFGTFSQKMQVAKVLALFEKGNRASVSAYRGISILPTFSKAWKKIIFNRLFNFSEKNLMFSNFQYAFRKRRSAHLTLLEQKEFILKNIKIDC